MIFFAQSSRNWSDMGMILLVIIVVVTIIDYTKLLHSENESFNNLQKH